MLIETSWKDDYCVVRVRDNVTLHSDLSRLKEIIAEKTDQGTTHIALRFTDSSYFYTKQIATLVFCLEKIREVNGTLALIAPNENILDVLKTVGFMDFARVYDSEDDFGNGD